MSFTQGHRYEEAMEKMLRHHSALNRLAMASSTNGTRGGPPAPRTTQQPSSSLGHAELSENKEMIRLMIDLPGVFAKDLTVSIDRGRGVLTIQGARQTMSVDDSVCVKKQKFSRRYAIDTDVVDIGKAKADLLNGVLTIKAPKRNRSVHLRVAEHSQSQEIPIAPANFVPVQATAVSYPETENSSSSESTRVQDDDT